MQAQHLNLGPNHGFIKSFNFKHEVSDFKSLGTIFQICGPTTLTNLSPMVALLKRNCKVFFLISYFYQTNLEYIPDSYYLKSEKLFS